MEVLVLIGIPTDLKPLVLGGDVLRTLATLPLGSVHTAVFSPPFWGLRRYDVCVCSLTRHATAEFRAWGGVAPDAESTGQISADDRRNRKEPDPNCPWCHGTGTIPGMETVWGLGELPCPHEWAATPPRRPRRTEDMGNLASHGNYDARGGAFCARCGAWRGSLGLEPTPQLYTAHMVEVFRALRPVLRDDAIAWAEIGDTYITHPAGLIGGKRWAASTIRSSDRTGAEQAGLKDKRQAGLPEGNLAFVPHRVAMALQDDGWIVRQDVVGVWDRPNPMPESVKNRPSRSHSYIFQVTKSMSYYWDRENARQAQTGNAHARGRGSRAKPLAPSGSGIRANESYNAAMIDQPPTESGRNIVSVWRFPTRAFKGKHYATYPVELPRRCISIATSDRGCCPECGGPFERVTTLGVPDRLWRIACGADARGRYRGRSKGGHAEAWAEDPSDVKRRILAGMFPQITIGWRPTCSCFPDPCDRCGAPWVHAGVRRLVSTLNKRVRDEVRGTNAARVDFHRQDVYASDEETDAYGGEARRPVELDVSWPTCSCRPLVAPVVLDPFAGSGTTLVVGRAMYRRMIGIELSPYYVDMARSRVEEETRGFAPKFVPQRRITEFAEAT